ncbi:MAG TPA: type II secretion system minor pseudopilin GspI [Steroidobacteraceae bacterium]|nr:type II secretion system minor pseudopilin GspI [Steroidobacteraceae bacterium]
MKARGFTLLEVLIALAIVALAVGALLGTVSSSASNVIYLKEKTVAEWVALNRLTEVRIWKEMPDKGRRTGNTEMAGMKWQWEEEVIELPVKGMFRVEVRARPTGDFVDDNKTLQKASAQVLSESKSGGDELDKLGWTSSVVGVIGTSRSEQTDAVAAFFASGQNGPGGPAGPNDGKGPPGEKNPTPVPRPGIGNPDR